MVRKAFLLCMLLITTVANAEYPVGSVAIYSDGRAEKLLQIGDGWTQWEDERKRRYTKSNLPFMPLLKYQKFPDRSVGYTQSIMSGDPQLLMPFGHLAAIQFDVSRHSSSSGRTTRSWRCKYAGVGSFTLDKKKLATEKYSCARSTYTKGAYENLKETLELKFSTKLGMVVDRRRTDAIGNYTRVKLIRLLRPDKVTAKRIARTVYKIRNPK